MFPFDLKALVSDQSKKPVGGSNASARYLAFVVRRIRIIVCRMWAKRLQSLRMRDQVFPTTELLGTTPRKYAILPCGNLDFESGVTAQNDEFKGSFHSSHPRLLNASTLSDTFVKCICRNLSCAPGKWRLHSSRRSSSRLSLSYTSMATNADQWWLQIRFPRCHWGGSAADIQATRNGTNGYAFQEGGSVGSRKGTERNPCLSWVFARGTR